MSTCPRIRVRIGSLAVHGVSGLSRLALSETVRSELTHQLLQDRVADALPLPRHLERVDAGACRFDPSQHGIGLGREIAAALHRVIGP